jgi:hypothetical protein
VKFFEKLSKFSQFLCRNFCVVNSTDFAPKKIEFRQNFDIQEEEKKLKKEKTAAPNFVCGPQKDIYESWAGRGTYDIIITRHKVPLHPPPPPIARSCIDLHSCKSAYSVPQ